jgi:hypothetical protein
MHADSQASSPGGTVAQHAVLDVRHYASGAVAVVELDGTLDLSSATRLLSVLSAQASSGARVVVCDLSRLAVPQLARLLVVFPAAQRRSGPWPRSALHLAVPGCELAQQLRWMGMSRFVPVHATMGAALHAATADASAIHSEVNLMPEARNSHEAREALNLLWPEIPAEHGVHQDGLLVAGELTSNAARHSGGEFTVSMALTPARFLVAVTDGSRRVPTLRAPGTSVISSQGMQLVGALSQDWGVRLVHGSGKTVWATFDRRRVWTS